MFAGAANLLNLHRPPTAFEAGKLNPMEGKEMKTTITISIERVEDRYRVKISHEGDQLDHPAITVSKDEFLKYWEDY